MAIFKCKMCGGDLNITNGMTVCECEYCGTKQTLPKLDNDKKSALYDRANHFRRNNDFDKAMGIYEQILNEDSTDAEAYWSLVLCRYGIEYVEDPSSHKRIPTVNRAQFTSIYMDEDYKSALQYADGYQKQIYEEEAKAIDDIQKGILEISSKEDPFDVFICYKETDSQGRRTQDSVLATDLYHQLTNEGFKVFFSRITLEDKLGVAYEPYIFAALNSSKVMVVLGTKPEFFSAVWVKNEWSRYLTLVKQSGGKKVLIPAYRDMNPYDLPEEFSHLQAQDMSKLGFMQDLIRGIKKIVNSETAEQTVIHKTEVFGGNANINSLLKRAFMFLEDGNFESADEYCEKVLDFNPECPEAYLGKLMVNLQIKKRSELENCAESFDNNQYYQKVVRFGDEKIVKELNGYIAHINERNENNRLIKEYNMAVIAMESAYTEDAFKLASEQFKKLSGYKDSDTLAEECIEKAEECRKGAIYNSALSKKHALTNKVKEYESAIELLKTIPGWRDSDEQVYEFQKIIEKTKAEEEAYRLESERRAELNRKEEKIRKERNKKIAIITTPIVCVVIAFVIVLNTVIIPNNTYNDAVALMKSEKYSEAINVFEKIKGYNDSDEQIKKCKYNEAMAFMKSQKYNQAIASFIMAKNYKDSSNQIRDIIKNHRIHQTISAGCFSTVGLKSDGTVLATEGPRYGQSDVQDWKDIVSVSAGWGHTVGLKSDGTVVATGENDDGQCGVKGWNSIVDISAGLYHTVGLKSDGTVVYAGDSPHDQRVIADWKDIIEISAGSYHTIGLKSDGTVVATGSNDGGKCSVGNWKDIVRISASAYHTIGLKSDGTVVATGSNDDGQCDVQDWEGIIDISAGTDHTIGLKSDGTVVATKYTGDSDDYDGQCDVQDWEGIIDISAGTDHTIGLKSDGTVVVTGSNVYGQCDTQDWTNIKTLE